MAEHEYLNAKNAAVVHNASKQRFEINIGGQLSMLEYTFKNHRLFLTHTEVPPANVTAFSVPESSSLNCPS